MSSISIKNKKIHKVESGDIFVHRGYPLGNPFICEPFGPYTRDECLELYRDWIRDKIKNKDKLVLDALSEIKSRIDHNENFGLVCYCAPLKCHASIILEEIQNYEP